MPEPRTKLGTHWRFTGVGSLRGLLRSEFIRHGAIVFASTLLVNLFNYTFHFLISRKLGVANYGALSSLLAALAITSVPGAVLTFVVVKYAAEFHALGDAGRLRGLSERLISGLSWVAAGVLGAGIMFRVVVAEYLHIDDARAVAAISVTIAVGLMLPAVRGVLQGVQDFRKFAISAIVESVGKTFFGVALVYAGFGLLGAVFGYVLASVAGLVYTLIAVRSHFAPERAPLAIDLRRLVQTLSGVALTTLAITTLGFADIVLVKHFFSPEVAGIYSAVSLVGKVLLFVVGFVPAVVLPKATAKAASGESPRRILLEAGIVTACISLAGLTLVLFFPTFIVRTMAGPSFIAATQFVLPYSIAMTLLAGTTVVTSYKIGLHRFDFVAPLATISSGEIVAMHIFHANLQQIIDIVLIGHSCALAVSLYRVAAPIGSARPGLSTTEVA